MFTKQNVRRVHSCDHKNVLLAKSGIGDFLRLGTLNSLLSLRRKSTSSSVLSGLLILSSCSATFRQSWCVETAKPCFASRLVEEQGLPRVALLGRRRLNGGGIFSILAFGWRVLFSLRRD